MSIRKPDGQSVMDFYPHAQEPLIYWLNAEIVKDKRVVESLALSTTNSYDLWHRHLGHPSSDIICQFSRNTVGLPDTVPIPKDVPVCKGCSEGKMTSSSFSDSTSQATEPFGLVHSDLKQFPIQSYHKYKYIITFYDDYMSHGWISLLKTKGQAYQAITNFLAGVKNTV